MFLLPDLPYKQNDFTMKKNLVRLYPPCARYGCAGKRNSFQKGRSFKLRLGEIQQLQDTSAKSRVFQGVDRWDDFEKVKDANYFRKMLLKATLVSLIHFFISRPTHWQLQFFSVLCGAKFENYRFWGKCTESNKDCLLYTSPSPRDA